MTFKRELTMWEGYISAKGLQNLAHYSYSGKDLSILGNNVLVYFWNWVIEMLIPLWVAPNLLTFVGLWCNVGGYLVLAYYTPTLTEAAPSWAYFMVALLFFIYQTLDNIDGKQARRTKSSSPLGELFDHVCDSCSVPILSLVMGATFRVGTITTYVCMLVGFFPFYLAHWEEYFSGILILGKYNSPTEIQCLFMAIQLVTMYFGSEIWLQEVWGGVRANDLFLLTFVVGSIVTCYHNYETVMKVRAGSPAGRVLRPLWATVILGAMWGILARHTLMQAPHMFSWSLGFIFAYLITRLIVQRICKEPTEDFYLILIPLMLAVVNSLWSHISPWGPLVDDYHYMLAMFTLNFVWCLVLSVSIISQLCTHLNISCFTIPYPPPVDINPTTHTNHHAHSQS